MSMRPPSFDRILGRRGEPARVRSFLVRQNAPDRPSLTWVLRMWDSSMAAPAAPPPEGCLVSRTRQWPGPDGDVRAVLLYLGDGEELLPVAAPDARDLEEPALARGEADATRDGLSKALVLAGEEDTTRQHLLAGRGYTRTTRGSTLYRYGAPKDTPAMPALPTGYAVRSVRESKTDLSRLAALLDAAFPRDTHDVDQLLAFRATAPCYVPELDLVTATSDGVFTAHVSVCLDRRNARALCEPVCTHPAHRRQGLARALMLEGMRRAFAVGARVVDVETGDDDAGAKALYESMAPAQIHRAWFWEKVLGA